MSVSTDDLALLLRDVADHVILPRWRHLSQGEIDEKSPGDFVTVADRESEVAIAGYLRANAPGCVIVGEEAAFLDPDIIDALASAELAYVIDPVDGTKNFVQGSPDFAVMVSEVRSGVTTRAWIWQPVAQDMWVAEHGAGLVRNDERVCRPSPANPARGRTSLRDHWEFDDGGRLAPIARSAGAVGIDYPRLCEGRDDFLVYNRLKPWDHLPGTLMVREVGGVAVHFDGTPYGAASVGRTGLVAAADDEVATLVREAWEGSPL